MSAKTIVHVMGARPNYMKIAPLMRALEGRPGLRQVLVNTGQHYDDAMSGVFIRELHLPLPDRNLEVGSGSHAVQTHGTNRVVGTRPDRIAGAIAEALGPAPPVRRPDLWDGRTAERIADVYAAFLGL